MLKVRVNASRTIAFSVFLLMGSPVFAASPTIAVKPHPVAIHLFSPLKMPRYEQWKKLSPKAREEFVEDVQAFLLRADAMARFGNTAQNSSEAQIIQSLFDLWIETAEAQTKPKAKAKHSTAPQQPYCINQGVVKPLSDCDTKLGYKMHDFDTNEKLSPLGDASKCQAPEKPCSPFFGFTADGQMFCSSLNLTRDCAQKSAQPGTITLANTLAACEKGSPGTPKVDCGKLKSFFDDQMKAVEDLCKDAPKRFACGILKDQIQGVVAELQGKGPTTSAPSASDSDSNASSDADETGVPDLANHVKDAVKMERDRVPCPPTAEPKAVVQNGDKASCVSKPYPQNISTPFLDELANVFRQGAGKDFLCAEMQLPNQAKFSMDFTKNLVTFQANANSAPVSVSALDYNILITASHALQEKLKVDSKDLLASYIPKIATKDAGKASVGVPGEKEPRVYSTSGFVSANGTTIRYALDDKEKALLLFIKRPSDKEETLVGYSLKDDQEEAKAKAQAKPAGAQK